MELRQEINALKPVVQTLREYIRENPGLDPRQAEQVLRGLEEMRNLRADIRSGIDHGAFQTEIARMSEEAIATLTARGGKVLEDFTSGLDQLCANYEGHFAQWESDSRPAFERTLRQAMQEIKEGFHRDVREMAQSCRLEMDSWLRENVDPFKATIWDL